MTDLQLVLALLVAAIVMFAANRPRMDAVGLLMLTLLPFTGVISMSESLAGFADATSHTRTRRDSLAAACAISAADEIRRLNRYAAQAAARSRRAWRDLVRLMTQAASP